MTPWTVTCQVPLSMGFPRQENWSGLPFPPPGDLLDPGTKPESPASAGGFFTTESPGKPIQDLFRATVIISTFSPSKCPIWPALKLGKNGWCHLVDDGNLSAQKRTT